MADQHHAERSTQTAQAAEHGPDGVARRASRGGGQSFAGAIAGLAEIPSEALERREVRALLQQAIEHLSPIYREVLVLRDIEEFSIEETAGMLAISISSVKVRLHRARIMLQKDLAPKLKLASPKKRRWLSWY